MTNPAYGFDFGTSNSTVALAEHGAARLLPIDPAGATPTIVPSVLFVAREGGAFIGNEAIAEFVNRNAGREIVRTRVNSGKIVSTHYGDEWVQFDADVELPGRFFQSLKSFLRDESFEGTNIFGRFYTLEELIATFMRVVKQRADSAAGVPIDAVVMGRPVHFSDDRAKDAVAQARLLNAAQMAGFIHTQASSTRRKAM